MPAYNYKCSNCGEEEEMFVHVRTQEVMCDKCGGVAKKQLFSENVFAYNDVIPSGEITSLLPADDSNPNNHYDTRTEREQILERHNERYPSKAVIH